MPLMVMTSQAKAHGSEAKMPNTVSPFAHLSRNANTVAIASLPKVMTRIVGRAAAAVNGGPSRRRPSLRSTTAPQDEVFIERRVRPEAPLGARANGAPVLRRDEAQHALEAGFIELQRRLDPEIGDPGHFLKRHRVHKTPRAIQ